MRHVWLCTRPLAYGFLPAVDLTSDPTRLYLRHWGVLVSELAIVDVQVLIQSIGCPNVHRRNEIIGTMYQLMQHDNRPDLFVDSKTTLEVIKTGWKSIYLQYVGETSFTHGMIIQQGTYRSGTTTEFSATHIVDTRPDYHVIHNNCQNFATYLLETLCPGAPIPDTIAKVLQGMVEQFNHPPSFPPMPGTYPESTIPETNSYVTASETSWWTAGGTEWVSCMEHRTSTTKHRDASSTIADFMVNQLPTSFQQGNIRTNNTNEQLLLRRELIDNIRNSDLDGVLALLDEGVDIGFLIEEPPIEDPLEVAVEMGSETIVKLLIDAGAEVGGLLRGELTLIHLALKCRTPGQLAIVKLLADAGVNVFTTIPPRNATLLHYAVLHDQVNPQIVEYLLESGLSALSVTLQRETPLHWAMRLDQTGDETSRFQSLRLLLQQNINVVNFRNEAGETALELAMHQIPRSYENVLFLLEMGADCHFKTRDGETAVHLLLKNAARYRQDTVPPSDNIAFQKILDALITQGVDLGVRRFGDGRTVFHIAVRRYKVEILKKLVQNQPAPVSISDATGNTPLHIILKAEPPPPGYRKFVQCLISANANLSARNNQEWRTPLLSACANPYIGSRVVEDLIEAGSDLNSPSKRIGETPLSLILNSEILDDLPENCGDADILWRKAKVLVKAGFKTGPYERSKRFRRLFDKNYGIGKLIFLLMTSLVGQFVRVRGRILSYTGRPFSFWW
jgi:ankyrin repeat protein